MKKILLISTQDNAPSYSDRHQVLQTIADALDGIEATIDILLFEEMEFVIQKNQAVIWNTVADCDIADYDLVYVKNWKAHQNAASALAVYLDKKNVRYICSELRDFRATDKISEGFLFALNGLPYPDTYFTVHTATLVNLIEKNADSLSYPFILKAVDASAGQDNHLITNQETLLEIIKTSDLAYMVQNFIPNDGDHRILVLGYEPKLAFKRTRQDESSHLNNTSQGASAILTDIAAYSDAVIQDAVEAARLVRREIAGADVLFNKDTSEHFILEVNASPQLATGAFLPEKKKILNDYLKDLLDV
jgi:glutathione synthase/RimK-type ligase-like ATP-grasp enzyme